MAETMLMGVDVGGTFTDLVPVDRRATDELRRRGQR
jgi:N-methylhydantoinase A/oxoprolinase/acetone carboxylase beta subunit